MPHPLIASVILDAPPAPGYHTVIVDCRLQIADQMVDLWYGRFF
ncbi:hypothetical protein [Oscillochloris sp. ZM17-4]|nr:hypothetical protein [Oscillochloris sp. ZM17-4]